MKTAMISKLGLIALMLTLAGPAQAQSDESNRWEYAGAVYLWGAGIGGRTLGGSEVEVGFSDLVDNLELAFMGAFSARKNDWSILTDVIFMDISAGKTVDVSIPIGPVQVPVTTAADLDLTGWVYHLAVGYEVHENRQSRADFFGGFRYLDLDMDLFLELQSIGPGQSRTIDESLTAWDAVVGMRGRTDLSDRWHFRYHLDMGAGESNFTWQAAAGVGFQAGEAWDVALIYRHLEWDLDSTRVVADINFSGPTLGVVFRW